MPQISHNRQLYNIRQDLENMQNAKNSAQKSQQKQFGQLTQQMNNLSLSTSVADLPAVNNVVVGSKTSTSKNNTFSPFNTIVPITRNIKINPYCYCLYSTLHKVPLAVHEFLDKSIMQGSAVRDGKDFYQQQQGVSQEDIKFYADSSYYQKTGAYKNMSYDKGHMAPAKNYCGQQQLMDSTYTFANCIPQNSYFNRGTWKNLQSYCRNLIRQDICETIEIISGPVFYSQIPYIRKSDNTIIENLFVNEQVVMLKNGIVVPPMCYKIIKANLNDRSYMSAFVLQNQKRQDNNLYLKEKVVNIEDLQLMTGLTFKLGVNSPLEDLDPVGMSKTFGDLHLQFYTKLYKFAKTIADMNGARKQGFGYKVKVDIQAVPEQQRARMAEVDFTNIVQQKDWQRVKAKSRRKINSLLALHKDCTQLNALSQDLDKRIKKLIFENLQDAKVQQERQYYRWISGKLYKNNYKYHYPYQEQLKKIFPEIVDKSQSQSQPIQQNNQQSKATQQAQISSKMTKKKYTPKKQKQENQQTHIHQQELQAKNQSAKKQKKYKSSNKQKVQNTTNNTKQGNEKGNKGQQSPKNVAQNQLKVEKSQ